MKNGYTDSDSEDLQAYLQESRRNYESVIEKRKAELLNRYCPIMGGSCSDECIHFKEGHVKFIFSENPHEPGYWSPQWPQCRLWGSL